ncbi:mobilization protein MobC [Alkalibaculum bacchi]|jgi:hypothetical protein|uniref:Mobilization protein MobC n=1 Tax=Alkalibaculum bacchi TaxID=645887 RepID=A0A366HYJ8_9FIRM|nr:plasmid mobilization relaxosome protein MobC [Alkalibaculum bacchi]RBP57164.1 mobilization protein MobC [Alkalibaculum bacchi]
MSESKAVKFRLKEDELIRAKLIAEHFGITINALAKYLVLNLKEPKLKIVKDKEFEERLKKKEVNKEIGAIGNNINQIARKVNSLTSYQLKENVEKILHELREIRNETRQLTGKSILSEDDFEESFKSKRKTPKRSFFN